MRLLRIAISACCLFWAAQSPAGLEKFDFSGNVDEDRYKELITEIRCLVCQNQSLADSDAELAHDLEYFIYHKGYGPTIVTLENYLRQLCPELYRKPASQSTQPPDP